MADITNIKIGNAPVLKWKESSKGVFTQDDMIDAYLSGRNATRRILEDTLKRNLEAAKTLGNVVIAHIRQTGFSCSKAFIKVSDPLTFEALFIIPEDEFLSDKFDKVYVFAERLRKERQADAFLMDFTFLPESGSINREQLNADGYLVEYVRRQAS